MEAEKINEIKCTPEDKKLVLAFAFALCFPLAIALFSFVPKVFSIPLGVVGILFLIRAIFLLWRMEKKIKLKK